MSKSQNLEIKELVVGVIDNITQARVENIMSGWRAILRLHQRRFGYGRKFELAWVQGRGAGIYLLFPLCQR